MDFRLSTITSSSSVISVETRVAAYDWQARISELDNYGCTVLPKLLSGGECHAIAALYPEEEHFRSYIHMAQHGFGRGEYRYFKYPLPDLLCGGRGQEVLCDVAGDLMSNVAPGSDVQSGGQKQQQDCVGSVAAAAVEHMQWR